MYTAEGFEVKSFSELRNIYSQKDSFLISRSAPKSGASSTYSGSTSPTRRKWSHIKSPYKKTSSATSSSSQTVKVVVKGTQKEFFPPSKSVSLNPQSPDKQLTVDWVYGYNGSNSQNLFLSRKGELVYYFATLVVLFDKKQQSQRHYSKHTEDVTCLSMNGDKTLALSGQRAGKNLGFKSNIHLWSLDSLQPIGILELDISETGVFSLAFSENSSSDSLQFIGVVQDTVDNYVGVWNWKPKTKTFENVGKLSSTSSNPSGCAFHHLDNHMFITFGKGHLVFWNHRKDKAFDKTELVHDNRTVTGIGFLESGDVVASDDTGMVGIYSVNNNGEYFLSHDFEAHNKGVAAIVMLSDGILITAGAQDFGIASWDTRRMFGRKDRLKLPDGVGTIKSFALDTKQGNFYVGTDLNYLMLGSMNVPFETLTWCHSRQISCVAPHPMESGFVSVGYDKIVARWSHRSLLWKYKASSDCLSTSFHPNGNSVAVGTLDGLIFVLNNTGTVLWSMNISSSPLNTLEFSPDLKGTMLAIGSHTGTVHTFSLAGMIYKRIGRKDVNGSIMHMDWNIDGDYLQLMTFDYNTIFMDAKGMKIQSNMSMMKDASWHQQSCTLGWHVAGTWNNTNYKNNPTTITAVHVNKDRTLLACGDAHGYLRLFNHPCPASNAKFVEAKHSSSAITALAFLAKDQSLISSCSVNLSLIEWKISPK